MSDMKINSLLGSPIGQWVNNALLGIVIFLAVGMYGDFKDMQKSINAMLSKVEVHEYRLEVIERTK